MEGKRISHYRILEKLGAGGMGEVYLAEDTTLGRKVALKLLGKEFTTNRDRLSRFEQEACAASALNHPNILTIHEVGVADGHNFIATEFVDGLTLRKRVGGARLELSDVLEIGMQVASALEEAHAAGIVHRDIKPENIMVRRNGYVKILDFGLAKLTEIPAGTDTEAPTRALVHTDAGTVMGTSHYMSPEQARGKKIDAHTDIWSLGVVLYELVAGRVPFEGETATDVLAAITKTEPPPLARYAQKVPAEFEWIVMKALRKDVGERYQTAKELYSDLKKLRQRLEFEAELERSVPPDRIKAISNTGAGGSAATGQATPSPSQPGLLGQSTNTVSAALPTKASSAEYIVSEIKRHKLASVMIVLIAIAAIAATGYLFRHRAAALTEKDTILLADFVNTTGESVFDGTLKQALAVQLGQSPFLNIFPEERVRESLRFMGRSPDDRLTRDVAREICERQGLKAMLIGTISTLGSHYVITLEAMNAHTGDSIAREQVEVGSKEQVLASLGKAASELRSKLGESLSSIKKFEVPVEQATTSSLEALKAYAMGNEERTKGNQTESIAFYKRAIEIDPNFAMAYARLAVSYGNQIQLELAQQYVQKAFDLRDRVSERERLYISEKYCNYITGEIDKAVEVLQTWARLYPNDFIPHNNLSLNYRFLGHYDDALREALEAVRLGPNNTSARDNLIGSFMGLGRFDEAEQASKDLASLHPDAAAVHFNNYFFAFLRREQSVMERETQWARGKSAEADFTMSLVGTALFLGQLKKAEDLNKRAVDLYKGQDRKENASQSLTNLATNQAVLGRCQTARENIAAGLALSRGRISIISSALAAASCGDVGQAQALLDDALKLYPKDTPVVSMMAPLIKAQIERNRGNGTQAVELLESVRRYDLSLMTGVGNNYLRGQTYLQQHSGKEAAAEFQQILDHPGVDVLSALRPLAHLGLARAALLTGDTARCRKEYQDFFAAWKDADTDLPILIEAKKEYEQLK